MRLLTAAAASIAFTALPLWGQQANPPTFTLHGQILDYRSDKPVAMAEVKIEELRRLVLADSTGRFRFPDLPEGTYTFKVSRLGYIASSEESSVRNGNFLQVRLLPKPILLDGVTVLADRFEQRMKSVGYHGLARTRDALVSSTAGSVGEFLEDHFLVRRTSCRRDAIGRECLWVRGRPRYPAIYLDGMRLPGGLPILENYHPEDFYRVEVYPALAQVHLYTLHYVESLAERGVRIPPICIVCAPR